MPESATLWISRELAERIRNHGAEAYPNECCGALFGRDNSAQSGLGSESDALLPAREVLGLYPLVNRRDDSPHNRFSVTPLDVREAERASQLHGLDVVGWYHSHPDHPARPSQYDRDHAWPWYSYIILTVQNGAPGEMTSWRLSDDRSEFAPEPLEIRQHAAA
ncbi:MAG TPA: M67 family metallopeptidase [Candidatus Acidoferrum sp.]|nr:M67 family metallopeptidase [Candidatus Acidoferrum sp.]